MYGAIIGDIIGSSYESRNRKTREFPLFTNASTYTDDTVMTVAVARALTSYAETGDIAFFRRAVVKQMRAYGARYPHAGYGHRFALWLVIDDPAPYGSYGNGSAMRVSPVAWYASSLEEAETLAEASADVTHDHSEGIRGARAIAAAVYLARTGADKREIRAYIEQNYYPLDFTLDDIREGYGFADTCQATVPPAIVAFLEAESYEEAVRGAVSIGGDSDTIACMAGAIAEAYFGIPEEIFEQAMTYLDEDLAVAVDECLAYFEG